MNKKILRQGLLISLNDLSYLKQSINETLDSTSYLECKEDIKKACDTKILINIINKQPKCSDTWEIEK